MAIARALANDPQILLADEPTGSLDSASTSRFLELIEQLGSAGMTVVMVTHAADVAAHADRVIAMRDGRIVDSTPAFDRDRFVLVTLSATNPCRHVADTDPSRLSRHCSRLLVLIPCFPSSAADERANSGRPLRRLPCGTVGTIFQPLVQAGSKAKVTDFPMAARLPVTGSPKWRGMPAPNIRRQWCSNSSATHSRHA